MTASQAAQDAGCPTTAHLAGGISPGRPRACRPKAEQSMRAALIAAALLSLLGSAPAARAVAQQRARQRLQLVGLYRADGARGFTQGNRHQGALRHLRLQRHAGNQAAGRQIRLRRRGADGYFLERQIKAGVFQKLDKSKLPNLGNVWPEIAKRLATYDPGNQYAVNYMWGTTGIGYNVKKAREALGADAKSSTVLGHRVQAGEPRAVQGLRRAHAGFSRRYPAGGAALSRARSELERSRPTSKRPPSWSRKSGRSVRKFHSSEYLNALATGEICLVVGWSGDIKQAQKRAAEAKNGVEIGYAIPKSGAQMWFDNFAIPKDAKNVAEAHAFIDYMLRPEVAAKNSNFLGYANGNLASQKLIDKAVLDDRPSIRRRDDEEASIPSRARREDAAADQPAVDQDQDGTLKLSRWRRLVWPPAAVQPQPLLGMLAHPALDHW